LKSTPNILTHVAKNKLIKEYAFFLKIKSLHSNSVIYKPKQLYKVLKVSRSKINRHLAIIIEQGWGYYSKGNLVLNSAKTIHYNLEGYLPKHFTEIKSIEDIYLFLLKNKLAQKSFISNKISDLQSHSRKVVKSAYKYLGGEKKLFDDGLSLKTLSATFGMSASNCTNVLKKLLKMGLISVQKRFESFGQFNYHRFLLLKETYKGLYRSKGNNMIRNLSNKISILEL
jgi:DNA-binding MarR family transcriptional regulator